MPNRSGAILTTLCAALLVTLFPWVEAARAAPAAQTGGVTLTPAFGGSRFQQPLFVTHVDGGDGKSRMFVVEKTGTIRVVVDGQVQSTPFLDISSSISATGEQGLLGLAFHPSFKTNRYFYVYYTGRRVSDENVGPNTLARFTASANLTQADRGSERILFSYPDRATNHNGGMVAFSPVDGKLYVGLGDEGGGGDTYQNAQKLSRPFGKIFRLDVDREESGKAYAIPQDNPFVGRSDALPEIWAYGLRNPWRFSFDRGAPDGTGKGQLYVGDVGDSSFEEIDRVKVGKKGKNFGWSRMEGSHCLPQNIDCDRTGLKLPIHDYDRSEGDTSVTGGYVYRGSASPGLVGAYVFGDFISGRIWKLVKGVDRTWTRTLLTDSDKGVSSFGEDQAGELYVADLRGGMVYRLAAP